MRCAHFVAGVFLGLCLFRLSASGQDAAAATNTDTAATTEVATNTVAAKAAAVAEQQAVEEKFKQIGADLEALRAVNQTLLDKLSSLKDDLQQIRAEQARLAASSVSHDDLKPLAQRIEEVDKKREEDKQLISDEIKKTATRLESLLAAATAPAPKPVVKLRGADAPVAEDGFSYTIKDGDRLSEIVVAYNADFKSKGMKTITLRQAMEANPEVDWTHLKVGQKIVIPHPAD